MADSIVARMKGDEYQQLVFWIYALSMLNDEKHIMSISYEDFEVKSFDDVVIMYSTPKKFRDSTIEKEYLQIKFHMRNDKFITLDSLLDPSFIGATTSSFLDNAVRAYREHQKEYKNSIFSLYTTYDIKQDDDLFGLISNVDSTICTNQLFDGTKTDKSKKGKIRKKLREKLGVSQGELEIVLKQIKIYSRKETIDELIKAVNQLLEINGLQLISEGSYINPYTELISKLFQAGIRCFNKTSIINYLKNENLYKTKQEVTTIAIRSYLPHAETLGEEVDNILRLEDYFEARKLKDGYEWKTTIYSKLKRFLDLQTSSCDQEYHIQIDANYTIAFMTGRILDIKAGRNIIFYQRTVKGIEPWDCFSTEGVDQRAIITNYELNNLCDDVAIVIEFTHFILNDVEEYINEAHLKISRIINIKTIEIGATSVKDGVHAGQLVNQIKDEIDKRRLREKRAVLHFFVSCPVSIVAMLSRYSLSFGKVQMYEYDSQSSKATYFPTVLFSIEEGL